MVGMEKNKNITNRIHLNKTDFDSIVMWLYQIGLVENMVKQKRRNDRYVEDIIDDVWVEIMEKKDKLIELANKDEMELSGYVSGLICRCLSPHGKITAKYKKYKNEVPSEYITYLSDIEDNNSNEEE